MKQNDHSYFANRECPYFPCHANADPDCFNCLFCFCPLYSMGEDCGGNFTHTASGEKDCTGCLLPHITGGYEHIVSALEKEKTEEMKCCG